MKRLTDIILTMLHGKFLSAKTALCTMLALIMSLTLPLALTDCSIEPPLHLPGQKVTIDRQAVEIRVEVIWQNPYWGFEFLYAWEDPDIAAYGPAHYEDPEDYELRMYYLGQQPNTPHTNVTASSMQTRYFRSMFYYGYHDILVWSNIHTPDNTQTVLIDEAMDEVKGSVTRNNSAQKLYAELNKYVGSQRATIFNQPDIYYSAYMRNLEISPDTTKYDYYDYANKCWVKKANMPGAPLVYIYLIQVVLRNNNDHRITGVASGAVSGVTDSVNVTYGNSSTHNTSMIFELNMKRNKVVTEEFLREHHSTFKSQCTQGEIVDVLGGRFTTYGLCGQRSYIEDSLSLYSGLCPDNQNLVAIDFEFRNGRDSIMVFDLTKQMQHTCHGGVLTIELDASKIPIPVNPNPTPGGGSGFDPYVEDYKDSVVHEFDM